MFQYMKFEDDGSTNGDSYEITDTDGTILRWKKNLRNFLHSKPVQIVVITLVIIDCLLVMTELTIDLAVDESGQEEEESDAASAAEIIHYCSIGILSIFMVEISLKLFADFHHFITHKMEVFDAFIVVISFGLDIAVLFLEENEALVAFGLFVVLRLWRVVRIINGITLSAKQNADERVHAVKAEVRELNEKLDEIKQETEAKDQELDRLRSLLRQYGIPFVKGDASDA